MDSWVVCGTGCVNIQFMIRARLPVSRQHPLAFIILLRLAVAVLVGVASSGCTMEQFKKIGYTLSTQYSCRRSNEHLPNETVKDLECTNPVMSKDKSYEEYQKERKVLLKQQDSPR